MPTRPATGFPRKREHVIQTDLFCFFCFLRQLPGFLRSLGKFLLQSIHPLPVFLPYGDEIVDRQQKHKSHEKEAGNPVDSEREGPLAQDCRQWRSTKKDHQQRYQSQPKEQVATVRAMPNDHPTRRKAQRDSIATFLSHLFLFVIHDSIQAYERRSIQRPTFYFLKVRILPFAFFHSPIALH